MTLDLFLDLLRSHLQALQSSAWPRPHGVSTGPAIYFDSADTQALIAELTQLKVELDAARASRAGLDQRGSSFAADTTARHLAPKA